MNNRRYVQLLGVIIASIGIIFSGCKKINDATSLGGELLPPIDNVNTFDTSVSVEIYNGIFNPVADSQRLNKGEEHFLGRINNDPLFGGTDARMFFELKPTNYPFTFANADPDSLYIDSVVLVMNYVETYGDTLVPQTVNVYELAPTNAPLNPDSNYLINSNDFVLGNQLGSRTFLPAALNDSVKAYLDTTFNQLRIRLDDAFGERLLKYDTISGVNGAYVNDSTFKSKFKGFAVQSMSSGNAVMGFDLAGANTKLAIYYRYNKNVQIDTTVTYFRFNSLFGVSRSGAAQYVVRDHSFGEIAGVQGGSAPDQLGYVQNTPGSFLTVKIPDLANVTNRVIHRAELIVEQVYDVSDTLFPTPSYLYLDAYDPTIALPKKQYRTIPYDVIYDGQDFNRVAFGTVATNKVDANGKVVKVWKFNISRYVQHVLTSTSTLYDLRLSAPFQVLTQYGTPPVVSDVTVGMFINPTIVKGRVRVAGGTPASNPQRMRLRLVYSKI